MIKRIMALCTAVFVLLVCFCSCKDNSALNNSSNTTKDENISSFDLETSLGNSETSSEYEWEIHTSSNSSRDETSQKPSSTSSKQQSNSSKVHSNSSNESSKTQVSHPEVTIPSEIAPNNYYGFKELSKNGSQAELKAYFAFITAFGDYKQEVAFDFPLTVDELKRAYDYYKDDYPQHFWRGISYSYSLQGNNVVKFSLKTPSFNGDTAKIKNADVVLKRKIDKIMSGIKDSMSPVEKERYIHDYIVNNCVYDVTDSSPNAHNMYGALVEGKAVCEGYANAFLYLARLAGIECITVKGNFSALNGVEAHMWNMVKLDDSYYHVDVTADDPIVNSGQIDVLEHTYFNLSDNEISRDHKITQNIYTIPSATQTKYNFFRYYGLEFSDMSTDNFAKAYAFAAKNSYNYAEIKLTSEKLLDDCPAFISVNGVEIVKKANKLLGKQTLNSQSSINYMKNPIFNILSTMIEYK